MTHKIKIDNQALWQKPGCHRSISFSIAYVRVCEWVREPHNYSRPKPDTLEKAKDHAKRLNDAYILAKIQECYKYYKKVEITPTPKLPEATNVANRVSREVTRKIRQATQPYSAPTLTEQTDKELDG